MDLPVTLEASGAGGVDEMRAYVKDDTVQWALVRVSLGEGAFRRQRLLFLHVNGEDCPPMARGRANELTPTVQQLLRGMVHFDEEEGKDAFHASLQVHKASEVTNENVLQRVRAICSSVDRGHLKVHWLKEIQGQKEQPQSKSINSRAQAEATQAGYDKSHQTAQSKPEVAAQHDTVVHKDEVLVHNHGTTTHRQHQDMKNLFSSGRDALKAVGDPSGQWNWVFIGGNPVTMPLVRGGNGHIDEMRECLKSHPNEVLFGLVRMAFGKGRLRKTKHVFVHAAGSSVSVVARGRLGSNRPLMETAFSELAYFSVTMEVFRPEDLTLESVIERVRRKSTIDDSVLNGDSAGQALFSVEAFRQAMAEEQQAAAESVDVEEKVDSSTIGQGAESEVCSTTDKAQTEETCAGADQSDAPAHSNVEDVIELVRATDGPLNWVLFTVDDGYLNSRKQWLTGTQRLPLPGDSLDRAKSPCPIRVVHTLSAPQSGSPDTDMSPGVLADDGTRSVPSRLVVPGQSRLRTKSPFRSPARSPREDGPARPISPFATQRGRPLSPAVATSLETTEQRRGDDGGVASEPTNVGRRMDIAPATTTKSMAAIPVPGTASPQKLRFAGPLLLQTGTWRKAWQLYWFEVGDGYLRWWESSQQAQARDPSFGAAKLRGAELQRPPDSATHLVLRLTNGKAHRLDADAGAAARDAGWEGAAATALDVGAWANAMDQEGAASGGGDTCTTAPDANDGSNNTVARLRRVWEGAGG